MCAISVATVVCLVLIGWGFVFVANSYAVRGLFYPAACVCIVVIGIALGFSRQYWKVWVAILLVPIWVVVSMFIFAYLGAQWFGWHGLIK